MHIQFVEGYDAERSRRARMAAGWRQRRRRQWLIAARYVVVVAIGIVLAVNNLLDIPGRTLIGVAILLCAAWACTWVLNQIAARSVVRRPASDVTVDVTDVEVIFTTPAQRRAWLWAFITEVDDRDGIWIARSVGGVVEFGLPRECMTPSQITELRMFLVERSLIPQTYTF